MEKETFLKLTKGKIFTVTFRKKDNSLRTLNGVRGGKNYVLGTGKLSDKVIGVWDIQEYKKNRKSGMDKQTAGKRAFRSIIPDSIISLKVGQQEYK